MPSIAIGMDSVLKRYFDYYRGLGELPPDLRKEMSGHLIEKLKSTYYYDIKPNYCILGKLDDCLVTDEGMHVPLDHKTRASPSRDVHPAYQLQMEVYCILLNGNGLKAGDRAYLLYYYPLNVDPDAGAESINFGLDIKRVDVDTGHALQVIEDAIRCLESPELPESSLECEYCVWVDSAGGKLPVVQGSQKTQGKGHTQVKEEEPETGEEYRDSLF